MIANNFLRHIIDFNKNIILINVVFTSHSCLQINTNLLIKNSILFSIIIVPAAILFMVILLLTRV